MNRTVEMDSYRQDLIVRARANVVALNDLHPCYYRRGECIVCSAQVMIEALLEVFAGVEPEQAGGRPGNPRARIWGNELNRPGVMDSTFPFSSYEDIIVMFRKGDQPWRIYENGKSFHHAMKSLVRGRERYPEHEFRLARKRVDWGWWNE